jgi:hypothetical protein
MKIGTTLGFVLGATLVPAIALAGEPEDPYAAPSSTTTIVTPPQQPVIVVNPEPAPARTTVITQDPETYTVTDAWNAPVFATGAVIFAGSYGASAIVASSSEHVGADRLYVPVVGPWLALNDWGACPVEEPRCDETTTEKVLLVADGVFQAAGVITMVTGLLSPSSSTVVGNPRRVADTKVRVRPTKNGFAVIGKF